MRILYLDLDSLNPSHLGCYGYHRQTSPAIDAIAAQGIRMTNCYASDAPCLPSRTAFYSGRLGIQTGVVGHGGTAAQPKNEGPGRQFADSFVLQGLAWRLQRAGFYTAMISPFGQRHAAHWYYAGFNEMHNSGRGGMESAEHVQPAVIDWLGKNEKNDNWYLHVNFWDAHTPYRAPEAYGRPFANDPLPAWLDDEELIRRHNKKTGPHSSLDISMYSDNEQPAFPRQPGKVNDKASMRRCIDGYDTGIRYIDDQIAQIVALLKQQGIYEDTAIIISADHGENMGQLGIYGEHGTADHATCRVPMIIKWPANPGCAPGAPMGLAPNYELPKTISPLCPQAVGMIDDDLHYALDLAPTLMSLMGKEPAPLWDGQSFADVITHGKAQGRDDLVISQCAHVCQRSVRFGKWLYMRTYHDGFHLFPQEMLYDLLADPNEQNDVAGDHPDVCREGSWRLARWHDQQMHKMARTCNDVVDPLWTVIREGGPYHAKVNQLTGYLPHLENTGRAEGAKQLREKYLEPAVSKPR